MVEVADPFEAPSLDTLPEEIRVAVLDFSATWCGPCKRQDPIFQRVARTFQEDHPEARVAFGLVDVDRNQALALETGVKSVPTTLIMAREASLIWGKRWQEKARFTGVTPYPRLLEDVARQLDEANRG